MNHKINQILAAVLLVVALLTGQQTWAANDWNVQATTSGSTTTFTISRTNTTAAETVKYRFVNLSAYAGQHYNVTYIPNIGSCRGYFKLNNGLTVVADDNENNNLNGVRGFSLGFGEGSSEGTGIVSLSKEPGNQGNNPEFLNSLAPSAVELNLLRDHKKKNNNK